jgi:hypothetical protein
MAVRRQALLVYYPIERCRDEMRHGLRGHEPLGTDAIGGQQRLQVSDHGIAEFAARPRRKPCVGPLLEHHLLDAFGFQFRGLDLRAQLRGCLHGVRIAQFNGLEMAARGA